ncbi:histidine kinase dimerization/phospho-acceptor domain-containing protein [Nocardioides rubriscoriae]|uniref:histidine kinase dimerization/phospho-acceptor domain-containing protein n=1 Tax=Nocardioides rubriscoriae TaxID=642762 RepID=UPI0011DFC217|nr:histidine kinase dimerization/phospho-acceptor domain-containing protein [Nocardioides rubriscoriae]
MRERLTIWFIAITLLLLLGAGLVRAYASDGEVRRAERADATAVATSLASVVSDELSAGGEVDRALLEPFALPRLELRYAVPGAPDVVATGADRPGDVAEEDEAVASVVVAGGGTLTVSARHDEALEGIWGSDLRGVLGLFGLLAVIAGSVGYLVARSLSRPFRQLAVAAAALGRGRFDLDLPRGGVPEARAIATALELSASQLRDRLERERQFSQHASHVLRTPLTSLRFTLEELVDEPDLSVPARECAQRGLKAVAQLNAAASELVELSGRGVLVAGAAVPLRDLATQVAQRWADVLDEDDRRLTAAVEGDVDLTFTPGPVEQVLDLLLDDVVQRESGSVRLVFEGAASRLRVDVLCSRLDGTLGAPRHASQDRVLLVLDALGGRLEQPADVDVLRLHLPRR